MILRATVSAAVSITLVLSAACVATAQTPSEHFERTIAPLLARRCLSCHNATDKKGGLDLSSQKTALAGGEFGAALVAGNLEESLLWEKVRTGEMPPKKPLSAEEKSLLKAWIAGGAAWGAERIDPFRYTTAARAGYDWWALQAVVRPPLPVLKDRSGCINEIDVFVRAQLEANGLAPAPPADRRTLMRRLYFDLLGLPPSPEATAAFLADESLDAYERLVDQLLASPEYGVRWARHWLDLARFGESNGFEYDLLRDNAWPYRDWVVHALNADMPYDEFARLQLAGDVLRPQDPAAVAATGFLVAGPFDGLLPAGDVMKQIMRQDVLEDFVGTVSQTFLGLTAHCARCHDHKFDPVSQRDYYRLAAALGGVTHGEREVAADTLVPVAEGKPAGRKLYAVVPKPPGATFLLSRGNPLTKQEEVTPGGIEALGRSGSEFGLNGAASDAERRTRLAAWITERNNPLFARVMVNRLWHYHFGAGLVNTPNDFGFGGGRPSHPELLDLLASELVRHDFSLKRLQHLIVTSATYRQASVAGERSRAVAATKDADNRLLWRKAPQRLDAECARDAVLAVAGELNSTQGGPGYYDFNTYVRKTTRFYDPIDPEGASFQRRSLYRTWARGGRSPFLDTFDCPDPSTNTPSRAVTTTPLQALSLMNNSFMHRLSERLAARAEREAGENVERQIARVYALAYQRPPSAPEERRLTAFVKEHGLAALCRVVFNTSEFMYVE